MTEISARIANTSWGLNARRCNIGADDLRRLHLPLSPSPNFPKQSRARSPTTLAVDPLSPTPRLQILYHDWVRSPNEVSITVTMMMNDTKSVQRKYRKPKSATSGEEE